MSRALQCPVCGHRHAVDDLPDAPTFECDECGRILKVPTKKRSASSSSSSSGARPRAGSTGAGATILPRRAGTGPADQPDRPDQRDEQDRAAGGDSDGPVRSPVWLRVLAWMFALPVAAVLVFGVANATGLLTGSQLTDMFLEARLAAYGRLAAVLPVWALLAALIVQGVDVLWKSTVRRRRAFGADPVDEPETVDA
ncbi:MAG: hypothetical protein R3A49_00830 [Acidimicrobiia bacterium]